MYKLGFSLPWLLYKFCFQLLSLQTVEDHLKRLMHEISGAFIFLFFYFLLHSFSIWSSKVFFPPFKRNFHFQSMQNPVLFHRFSFFSITIFFFKTKRVNLVMFFSLQVFSSLFLHVHHFSAPKVHKVCFFLTIFQFSF